MVTQGPNGYTIQNKGDNTYVALRLVPDSDSPNSKIIGARVIAQTTEYHDWTIASVGDNHYRCALAPALRHNCS